MRSTFKRIWNGVASIIFFAGIFLGFSIGGYSATIVGIFMWIIGGMVANMLFGHKKSKKSKGHTRSTDIPLYESSYQDVPIQTNNEDMTTCPNCGTMIIANSTFCSECGITIKQSSTTVQSKKY